jgi:GT2 family glycosyltransferase/glycosyltransferase involved in cell wall biosynthesis
MFKMKQICSQQIADAVRDLLCEQGIDPQQAPLCLLQTSVAELVASQPEVVPAVPSHSQSSRALWLIGGEDPLCSAVLVETLASGGCQQGKPSDATDILLAICLDLPDAPSAAFAKAVIARTNQILMVNIQNLSADHLADWLVCFAQVGLICQADQPDSLFGSDSLLLSATERSSAEAIAQLSYSLLRRGRQVALEQQIALDYQRRWADVAQLVIQSQQNYKLSQQQLQNAKQQLEEFALLKHSPGYQLLRLSQKLRAVVAPPNSRRDRLLTMILGWLAILGKGGVRGLIAHLRGEFSWRSRGFLQLIPGSRSFKQELTDVEPIKPRPVLRTHVASVEIVICIHNALVDVRRCLDSIQTWTTRPYALILVDDGSDPETRDFLATFASQRADVTLLRSELATGYTRAANRGLSATSADYVVLLNSDTIVSEKWLDRLVACAVSDPTIGLVGPLSNTASWQSIPEVGAGDDWSTNPLPAGISVDRWAAWLAQDSDPIYPSMPFLNGFCLLIKREVLNQVGLFDEETFGEGYGEENDYALRAQDAGWRLALADDAYIYHAQSRSYSHTRRHQLSEQAAIRLSQKHSPTRIEAGVDYCQHDPVLVGIRARAGVLAERNQVVTRGRRLFGGRRLLFVLPLDGPAGGGNVVVAEGEAMRRMGVDVQIFNLNSKRSGFEEAFPGLAIPQIWGEPADVAPLSRSFDAVVATWHESVNWIAPAVADGQGPVVGYYIQDFEPLFYEVESDDYRAALRSYTAIAQLRRFTKTAWNRDEVYLHTGAQSAVVGPSVDIDRFRPHSSGIGAKPLRITAMIRPDSTRRAPRLTMEVLQRLWKVYGGRVEITLFGVNPHDPGFADLPQRFAWRLAGVVDNNRVAALMSQTDIFVDFSTYQAMGLTALEAMASGAVVIVPAKGGSGSFARSEVNALIVDTSSESACWQALVRLVEDQNLRIRLRENAIRDAVTFYPAKSAFEILSLLFSANPRNPT